MARLGVDFGGGETGVALLDGGGDVLDYRVILHRNDVSDKLSGRREIRAMRRRANARRRRLRDFCALLKGMDLPPSAILPGEKLDAERRILPGNRLYALAHRRGWDYAECLEMLLLEKDGKLEKGGAVAPTDRMLLEDGAPAVFNEKTTPPKKAAGAVLAKYHAVRAAAEKHLRERGNLKGAPAEYFRFAKLKTEFLGELFRLEKETAKLRKDADNAPSEHLDQIAEIRAAFSADKEDIKIWLRGRLEKIYGGAPENADDLAAAALVYLGLEPGEDMFLRGKIYRPHRNRHRNEMLNDMKELLDAVFCGGGKLETVFDAHFQTTHKLACAVLRGNLRQRTKTTKADAAKAREDAWREWQNAADRVRARAESAAKQRAAKEKREVGAEDVFDFWRNAAAKIIEREYRKKRFANRKIGKCPARLANGERCGKNAPRKNGVRALQFEIELRQINFLDEGEVRKLTDGETDAVMQTMVFGKTLSPREQENNRAAIAGLPKTPAAKNDSRGKKDILRDIACGAQNGRGVFCTTHLHEKLQLLKDGKTESDAWARLHGGRILTAKDAPPSVRQKVFRVRRTVELMLKRHKILPEQIAHVGLETARFDIHSLAQLEDGYKGKKTARDYQTSRRPADKRELAEQQGGLCLLCGGELGEDIHRDHFFPKSRGGANERRNFVALCAVCNIAKGNGLISAESFNEKAAAHLREADPDKLRHLQKMLKDPDAAKSQTRAPQHTMFGAKVLRGELQDMLDMDDARAEKVFRKIRAQDAALLREKWFPYMHRQKRALRATKRDKNILAFTAGEESAFPLKLNLRAPRIENGEKTPWLLLAEKDGKFFLSGAPPPGSENVRAVYIAGADGEPQRIRIAVLPPKDDGIRHFNHALDAAVLAADLDWQKIARLAKDARARGENQLAAMEKEMQKAAPQFSGARALPTLQADGKYSGALCAPAGAAYLYADREDRGRVSVSKYDREPYGFAKDGEKEYPAKRTALPQIARKNVKNIIDGTVRAAVAAAWADIDKLPDEQKAAAESKQGKESYIAEKWFLGLPKNHQLHPSKIRAARCWADKSMPPSVFENIHGGYYRRTEQWAAAVVFLRGGKPHALRRKNRFYWRDKNAPEYEGGGGPKPGEKILRVFRRGDSVDIDGETWEIAKLGSSATLRRPGAEKSKTYPVLYREISGKNRRNPS